MGGRRNRFVQPLQPLYRQFAPHSFSLQTFPPAAFIRCGDTKRVTFVRVLDEVLSLLHNLHPFRPTENPTAFGWRLTPRMEIVSECGKSVPKVLRAHLFLLASDRPPGIARHADFGDLAPFCQHAKPGHRHLCDGKVCHVGKLFGGDDPRRDLASRQGLASVPHGFADKAGQFRLK